MSKPTTKIPKGHFEHVITEECLKANPQLEELGIKLGETIYIPHTTTVGGLDSAEKFIKAAVDDPKENKKTKVDMTEYEKAYPKCKKFFISTDGQVFLQSNEKDAELHQKSIDEKADLVVHNVK